MSTRDITHGRIFDPDNPAVAQIVENGQMLFAIQCALRGMKEFGGSIKDSDGFVRYKDSLTTAKADLECKREALVRTMHEIDQDNLHPTMVLDES